MIFSSTLVLMGIYAIMISLFALSLFLKTKKLESGKRERIRDVMVIGWILVLASPFSMAGMLILLYGLSILLYEYYRMGKHEVESK